MTILEKKTFFDELIGKSVNAETMGLMIKLAGHDIVLGWIFGPGWAQLKSVEVF